MDYWIVFLLGFFTYGTISNTKGLQKESDRVLGILIAITLAVTMILYIQKRLM